MHTLVGFIGDWKDTDVSLGMYVPVVRDTNDGNVYQVTGSQGPRRRLTQISGSELAYVNMMKPSLHQPVDVETMGERFVLQSNGFTLRCADIIQLRQLPDRLENGWFEVRLEASMSSKKGYSGIVLTSLEAKELVESLYWDIKEFFFPKLFMGVSGAGEALLDMCMQVLAALPRPSDEEWLVLQGVFYYQKRLIDHYDLVAARAELELGLSSHDFTGKVREQIAWAEEKRVQVEPVDMALRNLTVEQIDELAIDTQKYRHYSTDSSDVSKKDVRELVSGKK